jgi:hypothetical protein
VLLHSPIELGISQISHYQEDLDDLGASLGGSFIIVFDHSLPHPPRGTDAKSFSDDGSTLFCLNNVTPTRQ